MGKKKKDGKIFTPPEIVNHMLYDTLCPWYIDMQKHIIDNSCGDGAFLCEIARKYCVELQGYDLGLVKERLETYIHGIEIDADEYKKCLKNLNAVAREFGITDVKWDIRNRDALSCCDFDGKMDFVVANPPYIRTHDLECDLSGYSFASEGMKDIYLAFYELGFRMLKEGGSMCYIAPSSWFSSLAGQKMRDYIMKTRCLSSVQDFGHAQVFENATTYVAICVFRKFSNPEWQPKNVLYTKGAKEAITVSYDDMCIDGKFYFGTPEQLKEMREIIECGKLQKKTEKAFQVKNGFATLADDIFIADMPWRENRHYIPTLKSSTGKLTHSIYPYDENGRLIEEDAFKMDCGGLMYNWLLKNKEKLEARSTTEPWYAFGRTQAIGDVQKEKWAIKSIVKSVKDVKSMRAPIGCGVYGGLYILTEYPEGLKVLETEEFMNYVKMLGKYKSGGYYTFSSKELENYLNWKYGKKKDYRICNDWASRRR